MSMSGAAVANVTLVDDDATCHNKNGLPNNASPCRDGSPMKSRGGTKRKSCNAMAQKVKGWSWQILAHCHQR